MDFKNKNIYIKEIGNCKYCQRETNYYHLSKKYYVCSKKCYNLLNDDYADKLNNLMDKISDSIDKKVEHKKSFRKEQKEGLKFLLECMLVLPKEVKEFVKNKKVLSK